MNPQFLRGNLTDTADTYAEVAMQTPVQRIMGGRGRKAVVMEILKIFIESGAVMVDGADRERFHVATRSSTSILSMGDSATIATVYNLFRMTTSGSTTSNQMTCIDVTDGAGHGMLVATDQVFFACQLTGQGAARTSHIAISYRLKAVALEEFIGIMAWQAGA